MYCKKCGAAVIGKFCSCCGTRVRTDAEEIRRMERQAKKEFIETVLTGWDVYKKYLAESVWLASRLRLEKGHPYLHELDVCSARESLEKVRADAEFIYRLLVSAIEERDRWL